MKKIRIIAVVVAVTVVSGLIGACAAPAPAPAPAPSPAPAPEKQTYQWKISQIYTDERNPNYYTVEAFADMVRQMSGGRIQMTHYAGELLGDWTVQNEEISRGSIELGNCGTYPGLDERVNLQFLNYLYFDDATARSAWMVPNGWIYKAMEDVHAGINIKVLWVCWDGWMGIGMTKGNYLDTTSVDGWFKDAATYKLRNEPAKVMELCAKAMGFNPTTIPYAELYTALQLGTVDGWIGGGLFHQVRWADTIKIFYQMFNKINAGWIGINLDVWNSLSAEDQKILQDAALAVQEPGWKLALENETLFRDEAIANGIEIFDISPDLLSEIIKRVREVEWQYAEAELIGKEMMDRVRANAAPLP